MSHTGIAFGTRTTTNSRRSAAPESRIWTARQSSLTPESKKSSRATKRGAADSPSADPPGGGPPDDSDHGDDADPEDFDQPPPRQGSPIPNLGGHPGAPGGGDDGPDDDDDNGDAEPIPVAPDSNALLAAALNNLAQVVSHPRANEERDHTSRNKVREPDQFDGKDPKKLHTFLIQCQLNFTARENAYRSDRARVTFAMSYLTGQALKWFEPDLMRPNNRDGALWHNSWDAFEQELRNVFGPYDAEGDAETDLENLTMRHESRITYYLVEFHRLGSIVQYGDAALARMFYKGLPDRIKDEFQHMEGGRPKTLGALRIQSQAIDQRYWERQDELNRRKKNTKQSPPAERTAKSTTSTTQTTTATSTPSQGKPKDNRKPGKTTTTTSSTTQSKGPDLSGILGPDGKITTAERQRRMDNKLCMFCGKPGHMAKDCRSAAKARAATTSAATPAKSEASASDKAKN